MKKIKSNINCKLIEESQNDQYKKYSVFEDSKQKSVLAILQKSLNRATFLYAKFDGVALGLLSLLCTFENSSKCKQTSFD